MNLAILANFMAAPPRWRPLAAVCHALVEACGNLVRNTIEPAGLMVRNVAEPCGNMTRNVTESLGNLDVGEDCS